ncbi:MAG: LysM peptidoglycan-binding domain-containing protein [Planctomycetes bacterium]|nr:LysM peptidoglycan-binding domain-containing protein [Planctomycetota bacterium]
MGKVEKFAVLSVLFLIAVILVVSMTTDNPVDKANAALLGEKPASAPRDSEPPVVPPAVQPESKLLSANLGSQEQPQTPAVAKSEPEVPAPLTIPAGSLLKSTGGLVPGYDSQRYLYPWQSGDSYVALAKRFYGEPTKFTLIQNANEGREGVLPGEKILIPIFDVESVVEAPAAKQEPVKTAAPVGAKSASSAASGRMHTVKKGESLWLISKAELGSAARWKEIYDLNTDKLKSPESLRDGMTLRLP